MAGLSIGATGLGVILAVVTVVLVRHNRKDLRAHKTAAFFALVAGLCLVSLVVAYTGGLASTRIAGLTIVLIIDFGAGLEFILNVRGHSHHPVVTPALGFILGVSLMLTPGAIGGAAHHAQSATVTGVSKVTGG